MAIAQELPIDSGATADEMAAAIFGDGVTVVDANYVGDNRSSGTFDDVDGVSDGVLPSQSGVILSTGFLTNFTSGSGSTNTNTSGSTSGNTTGQNNNALFNDLAGTNTYDASYLEIDFTSTGDTLTVDFVIASEEYPEWVNSQYNDVVGVWVNGVQAEVSIGDGTASIGNINGSDTANLYIDNTADQYNTQMDGFTITLTFTAPVSTTGTNTLIIGVADVADSSYDTALLIAGGSVQSTIVAVDDELNMQLDATKTIDVLNNDTGSGTLSVTHINGIAVDASDLSNNSVTLGTGQTVVLNLDGTFTVIGDGDTETVYFTYTLQDSAGNTDDGLVEVNQLPCFVAGTWIDTPDGPRPIQHLSAGDLVITRDNGVQPIRWIGGSPILAIGQHAPVRICKGRFGANRELLVSQQHRILFEGHMAELLFGEPEVLVRAKDLVDDRSIRIIETTQPVTYYHMLFDEHQVVRSHNVWSESYQPGPLTMAELRCDLQDEILSLFPQLCRQTWDGYGPSARLSLRSFEGHMLALAA